MDRLIERVVEGGEASDLVAMATLLYGLPRPAGKVDAVVVLPGLGEDWRLIDGIHAWNGSSLARHLMIAGIFDGEKTKVQPTVEYLSGKPFNLERAEGVLIQPHAHHTKEQAEWVVENVRKHGISSIALFVSPYHLLRAYCTVLKAFIKADHQVAIIPMPVAVSPSTQIPEVGVDAWTMSSGEVERIIKYQKLDDVATKDELKDYLAWLCSQPIMAAALHG